MTGSSKDILVDADELRMLATKKLEAAGLIPRHAELTADVVVSADINGVRSHGVIRIEHYVKRLLAGSLNKSPNFRFRKLRSGAGLLKADAGMGHVAGIEAMNHAIAMATESGIAMVGIKNSSHCGALSYFVNQAAEKGMIGIAMVHGDKLVTPTGGSQPFFGANPVAMGFPCKENPPVIIDMATSNVAFGKILHAREKGTQVPDSWGLDEHGQPTTDPHQIKSLSPFGGYKGYAIGMAIEVLTSILLGAPFGPDVVPMYEDYNKKRNLAGMMIAIDPATFITADAFLSQMDAMVNELHEQTPGPGFDRVLVPGEPELCHQLNSLKHGVTVVASIFEYLKGDTL